MYLKQEQQKHKPIIRTHPQKLKSTPQASWILIKQNLISNPRTTTARHTHHSLLTMVTNPSPPTNNNQNQPTTIINIATSTKRKREREREREKERSARWREDTSAARSARQLRRWDRLQAARFTNLSLFETHQSPPPNKRKLITTITSNTLPTSNNNQSQITICIKLSGDHHGRKKKIL